MGKPLFSTACTTCHARIAVLKEEAIGTIQGCPKCGGMVLVAPPEGWVSSHAIQLASGGQASSIPGSVPPPLNKVSQTYLTLDLELAPTLPGWQKLLAYAIESKIVWAGAAASACLVGVLIWAWTASSPSSVEIARAEVDSSKNVATTAPAAKRDPVVKPADKNVQPFPASVIPATASAELKAPEIKSTEVKIAETQPAAAKTAESQPAKFTAAPAPVEIKPIEANPPVPEMVEADPIEIEPAAEPDPRLITGSGDADPVLPSIPDLPPEVEIKPLPVEKPAPLPVTAAKLVKQVPPPEIDAKSRLEEIVPNLDLQDVPFAQALSIVSSISTLPITLDADAMRLYGVSPRDIISVRVKDATVETLLDEIASRRGLGVEIEKGQVLVTASAEQTAALRTELYAVSDLCENGAAPADLAELVQKFVAPDSWQLHGGSGSLKIVNDSFTIGQTGAVHREIAAFCDKLRLARGLPPRSAADAQRVQLASAYARAKPLLEKQVSANFHEPTPLARILDELGSRAGVDILIDCRALAAGGASEQTEVSYTVAKKPLETALDELLRPLALGYRAIDAHTLQVATQKELDRRIEWEIYPVGPLGGAEPAGRELILRVKQSVAPVSWTGRAQIRYDSASRSLLVSQSPAVQAALSRYLSETPPKK
ncbi:MAG: hypothetical protein IT426_01565 [Pirellulales bacterium]|nr:hypothetical protein [Pirellulales bacterium]